jgi:hypothetical protein
MANLRAAMVLDIFLKERREVFDKESMTYYDFAIEEAKDALLSKRYEKAPLEILWSLLERYDRYAHSRQSRVFKICSAAIDDAIDFLLTMH